MIDIGILKSIVELFKELLGLIDRRDKNRRDMFERTFKPLYERLEVIAKEYHGTVQHALSRLQQNEPDLESILNQLQAKRGALIIARNGVIGEALAFLDHYGVSDPYASLLSACPKIESKGEFEKLALEFAHSVAVYFQCANEYLEGRHNRDKLNWMATKFQSVAQAAGNRVQVGQGVSFERVVSYISRLGDDIQARNQIARARNKGIAG